ncbi:deoxyribonuclease IV [Malacoplasma muris]|uniref:deoxyribonuclease IV n=1 Tax=Malacoplasma muris TaxID=2119 RepID=UPI00398E4E3E
MNNKKILLGSHVGFKNPSYMLGSVHETLSYNANCFMVFTGPPQNFNRKEIDKKNVNDSILLMKQNNIDSANIIVHAPYLINLCSDKESTRLLGIDKLCIEVERTAQIKSNKIVLHPGSSLSLKRDIAIQFIAEGINKVFERINNDVIICIETMAGKGTEVGVTFEELKQIIDLVQDKSRIGVCLDTCHIHEAGYDISNVDCILDEFDKIIGLNKLLVIHLNDSKNERGAHKDRHENIGLGKIGFDTLVKWVHNERINSVPKILETPYYNEKPIYKYEITNLISGEFKKYE